MGSIFLLSLCMWAAADGLNTKLEQLIKASGIPSSELGLAVWELNPQKLSYGHNEAKDLIPASVTKLATAATVLQRLGPAYKFQTTLWSTRPVVDGVLKGDLILKGGGDPGFVSESMWLLVNELMRTGVRKIEGAVVIDDSDFDTIRADSSRDPERNDRAYDAPVGAMSFNWNSLNIYIRPTEVGKPPAVYLDPIDNGYKVLNKAKTVSKAGYALDVNRTGNVISVQGTIGVEHAEQAVYKNIDDPVDWSGRALLFFLSQRGVVVTGKVKAGKKPDQAEMLAKVESRPLSNQIADMMKFSNNYVAEMLTKDLAVHNGEVPGSLEAGMRLIRSYVENVGIESKRFTLVNPSGLSRRNRIRAADLGLILVQAQKSFPWFAEYLTGLPLAGLDGTLKKRMKGTVAEGWVRAKTGQLAGVAALAGYAGRKDGSVRAFAFIFNGKNEFGDKARHLFDELATELVQ